MNNRSQSIMSTFQFIGIDVAKEKFDVALDSNLHTVFPRNPQGFKAFIHWIKAHTEQPWIVMEATGYYSQEIAQALFKADMPVSIINPMAIKHFWKARLSRHKNDRVDAQAIAHYGKAMFPLPRYCPVSPVQKRLRALNQLLDTLKSQRVQLIQQKRGLQDQQIHKLYDDLLEALEGKIVLIEDRIDRLG
jgi:transposase